MPRKKGFKHSPETRIKMRKARLGRKYPQTSLSMMGERNHMWKGDNVGIYALHEWVWKRKPKTKLCQKCNEQSPHDLANKGVYNRDLENWEWLCRRCHMSSDGRLENLKQFQK